jgi:hypothetical protein
MSDNDHIGISKISRQKVIDRLKHSYANDYLDQDDFEKRVSIAMKTEKRSELYALVDDVPDEVDHETSMQAKPTSSDTAVRVTSSARDSDTFLCIFSGVSKKGVWNPPKKLSVVSIMGGAELDLTDAYIPVEGIEIDCFSFMGGTEIRVPAGVNVRTGGFAFMGGFENNTSGENFPGMPTIRINGFAFMGGVEIKGPRKPGFLKKMFNKMLGE